MILSNERFVKLAIVGSRGFVDYRRFKYELGNIIQPHQIGVIVSGGADGADTLADKYSREFAVPILTFYYERALGRAGGPVRNEKIMAEASHVIAFWDGVSPGTLSSINFAEEQGKYLKIVRV